MYGSELGRGAAVQGADVQRVQESTRGFFLFDVTCIVRGMSRCPEACSSVMCIMVRAWSCYLWHRFFGVFFLCAINAHIYALSIELV